MGIWLGVIQTGSIGCVRVWVEITLDLCPGIMYLRRMIIEIRAAEGGADAKDLVFEQFAIYSKVAIRRGL